jgi:hypothetical protein
MQNTVRLNAALLERAKAEARRRGETLTALIEQGLALVLVHNSLSVDRKRISLPEWHGGVRVLPGVDLDDSAAVLDHMERQR